ncbi:MAG: helix-turn-helix transcriptional regulator [Verrucomicrobium sp.]|nr:helix-turn-helix transcriptional regulator [Verrucomicrobium sp.]
MRVKELRRKAGLTQLHFAELAGISYPHYQDIELGRRPNVSIRLIGQIAKVYGLTASELFSQEFPAIKMKTNSISSPHYKKRKKAD